MEEVEDLLEVQEDSGRAQLIEEIIMIKTDQYKEDLVLIIELITTNLENLLIELIESEIEFAKHKLSKKNQ